MAMSEYPEKSRYSSNVYATAATRHSAEVYAAGSANTGSTSPLPSTSAMTSFFTRPTAMRYSARPPASAVSEGTSLKRSSSAEARTMGPDTTRGKKSRYSRCSR
jgi:hypothetical protein